MQKTLVSFLTIITLSSLFFIACKNEQNKPSRNTSLKKLSLIDSLKSICKLNLLDSFNINDLQTDDFKDMTPLSKELYYNIFPDKDDFSENAFFIYSYFTGGENDLYLITYQKNEEGEDYRVDYIDLVHIDAKGKLIESIRLAAEDNAVITYEVKSYLNKDRLRVIIKSSEETTTAPFTDTLIIEDLNFQLRDDQKAKLIKTKPQ